MTVGHAIWPDQLSQAERAQLEPGVPDRLDREPDVLIVGGGMLGCATAAACLSAGLGSIVVLERERLGAGPSGGAAGLLMPEEHAGIDPPELVNLMRLSLEAWRELDATWPGGVGLLPLREGEARVNPLRALARLAAGLPQVASGVGARAVTGLDGKIASVETNVGAFRPRNVIFATGTPPQVKGLDLDLPAHEVKGHMLASHPTDLRPGDTIADTIRVIEEGRILMGGTLDVGDDERVVRPEVGAAMWDELATRWPRARDIAIEYRWACFRPAHADLMPVIDRVPGVSNAWLTSGHYKTGILMAPATGRALAQWMATGSPPTEVQPFGMARLATPR